MEWGYHWRCSSIVYWKHWVAVTTSLHEALESTEILAKLSRHIDKAIGFVGGVLGKHLAVTHCNINNLSFGGRDDTQWRSYRRGTCPHRIKNKKWWRRNEILKNPPIPFPWFDDLVFSHVTFHVSQTALPHPPQWLPRQRHWLKRRRFKWLLWRSSCENNLTFQLFLVIFRKLEHLNSNPFRRTSIIMWW